MKVIVSAILLAILAWLVFSAPEKSTEQAADSQTPVSAAPDIAPDQEAERDTEALAHALGSIEQASQDATPEAAPAPEPEPAEVAQATTSDKGENAVSVEVEEFAALKGVDLEKPAAPAKQDDEPAGQSVDDIAAVFAQVATAVGEPKNTGNNYLSAIEDEASVTDLAIRKINRAIANIKPQISDDDDSYLAGLAGEAEETSVDEVYVADGTTPVEDFRETIDSAGNTYIVKAGDSLSLIAAQYYGDALMYHKIFAANRATMRNPDFLAIGQKLIIPPAN